MKIRQLAQKGFVLVTAMIFLVIMTLLAVTSIQRATNEEKVSGNIRAQNLAFQAAEAALRFCQKDLEATGPNGRLPLDPGTTKTLSGIPINEYPPANTATSPPPMPTLWSDKTKWTNATSYTLADNTILNVAAQPQCMIENWLFPKPKGGVYYDYVITARAVGSTTTSVVWLQATIRTVPEK
ncbi:MAG: hypothetical protein KGM99_16030 [Burkholderiales bacterium]|nr:hypothetical protein [Burkholderiales bacterium]